MTLALTATGLTIDTLDEIIESRVDAVATALSHTPVQKARMLSSVQSNLGNWARADAEAELAMHEALLLVYESISMSAGGHALESATKLFGISKDEAVQSVVVGTATGTGTPSIPLGTRLQYNPDSTIWTVAASGYSVADTDVELLSEVTTGVTVALDPDTGFDDWTVLDTVTGFEGFESTSQPTVGRPRETDSQLRLKHGTELFRRAQGPERAIEAAVLAVEGVTYVRAYSNRTNATDSDGIPGKAINVVVQGGTDALIAAAIFAARPAGAEMFGLAGASQVSVSVMDTYGFAHVVNFNRVDDVEVWVNVALTTSTSEESAPADIEDLVEALVLSRAPEIFDIGQDILPWRIAGEIHAAGYRGIDDVVVTLSLDGTGGGGGSTDPYTTARRVMTVRQQGAFAAARIAATAS